VIQTSRGAGMMTLNDSLIELVRKRVVDPKEAYMLSVNKTEFNGMLNKEGFAIATGS
jgi:twitching motility protein PilT